VSLNTSDPVYVTYFNKIKQLILSRWEYPELALRYGLEGRLSVEFTIGSNGQLERLRVVRSSGSNILDEEALRAIQAAAPFPPIPRWIQPNPLAIFGEMIYDDNRLNYQAGR
jgi:protein TonB